MTDPISTTMDTSTPFARHVAEGLCAPQARLSSRFIYDERGSRLFQGIMALEEYYLTRCETEIFTRFAAEIADALVTRGQPLELIELGAGDGSKTKLLLRELVARGTDLTYRPVDISPDILDVLASTIAEELPGLRVDPIAATYADALAGLTEPTPGVRRAVMFLGSNIGNFDLGAAARLLTSATAPLQPGDAVLLGVDLRKNPRLILRAYDDGAGVTAAFNLNLLHRLRRELGAECDLAGWGFYPTYNPETGEVRSYLYPIGTQTIRVPALGIERRFSHGETIHTEVSRKFSRAELTALAREAGAEVTAEWTDARGYFADVAMTVR